MSFRFERPMKSLLLVVAFALPVLAYLGEWLFGFIALDGSVFRYVGRCVAEGGVMYRCAWDNKGPMLLGANSLGWWLMGLHGPGLIMILAGLASVAFFYLIARRLVREVSAAGATLLYSTVLVGNTGAVNYNSQEWLAVFFILLGIWSLLRFTRKIGSFALGVCVGCVFLIKPNLVSFGGAALAMWTAQAFSREGSWIDFAVSCAWSFVGFAGVLGLVTVLFARVGAAFAMWDATLLFGLFEYCHTDQSWLSWAIEFWGRWASGRWVVLHYAALLIVAVFGLGELRRQKGRSWMVFLTVWLGFDLVLTFGFKTFYEHYLVVSYPELCLLFACALEARFAGRSLRLPGFVFIAASFVVFAAFAGLWIRGIPRGSRTFTQCADWLAENLPPEGKVALGGDAFTAEIALRAKVHCPQQYFCPEMNYYFAGEKRRREIVDDLTEVLSRDDVKCLVVGDVGKFVDWSGLEFVKSLPQTKIGRTTFIRLR